MNPPFPLKCAAALLLPLAFVFLISAGNSEPAQNKAFTIRNEENEVLAEVDILLENGNYIMAVEVKAKPRIKDIEHHIKRLEILRQHRNKFRDTRKIQGAIAGAIFGSKEKQAAIEACRGLRTISRCLGDRAQQRAPERGAKERAAVCG